MKRLLILIFSVLVIYVIYFDLSHGTLPAEKEEQVIEATSTVKIGVPFFEKKVSAGETVLSVVEQAINGPLPVTISDVVADFSNLNNGIKPEELKFGQTYRFPDYSSIE